MLCKFYNDFYILGARDPPASGPRQTSRQKSRLGKGGGYYGGGEDISNLGYNIYRKKRV